MEREMAHLDELARGKGRGKGSDHAWRADAAAHGTQAGKAHGKGDVLNTDAAM